MSELAFLRHAIRLGTAGPDAADQERRLLAILLTSRAVAVERAGLPRIELADPHR